MKRSDEVRAAHALHYDVVPPRVCLECDLLREIKRLESQNYRLNNRCVELEADSAMACESPDPECGCAGCSLARDVGGST